MKLDRLNEKKAELLSKMEKLVTNADDVMTAEAQEEFETLKAGFDATVKSIEAAETMVQAKANAEVQANRPVPAVERVVKADVIETVTPSAKVEKKVILPATVRKSSNLKAFTGADANEKAFAFGMWAKSCLGDHTAYDWCSQNIGAVHNETSDSAGGYLVPTVFGNDMQNLLNSYGVARKECNVKNMTSEVLVRPKTTAHLIAYPVTESADATESDKTYGEIRLDAKTWSVLTRMTKQLSADALISVADDLMNDIAYAFAYAEDNSWFNGDATATYNSITGMYKKLIDSSRIKTSAGTTLAAVTKAELREVVQNVPAYARNGSKWLVSPIVADAVFNRIKDTEGGNTAVTLSNGIPQEYFLNYPVVLCDAATSAAADDSIVCVFGNVKQAVDFGDRQQNSIEFSRSATIGGESVLQKNQIAVAGFERFDINVHSPEAMYGLQVDTVA